MARRGRLSPPGRREHHCGQKFGAKFTTDFDVSYTFMRHFTFTIGANNIFNTHPDKITNTASNPIYVLTGSTADGQVYPRLGGPFGINGGFWYVRASCEVCTVCLSPRRRRRWSLRRLRLPMQTCADGSVIAAGAACPVAAPPPPPASAASAGSDRAGRARQLTTGERGLRKGPRRKARPISITATNLID